jgi:UDP-4-amino-4,6-dideoxy-N-acetyl-beta-L-altrosamine transaminase
MKFFGYGRQEINRADLRAVRKILKSDYLTQGPAIRSFEAAICDYTGAKFCVAVSNGTAALHLVVAALNLPPGSKGISSPISFVATTNALIYSGLIPEFLDIDPETINLDISQLESSITNETSVVIPVHFAGRAVDVRRIKEIIGADKIAIIEDAAHAIGSEYSYGGKVGNCQYSDATIFSFHPVKTITTGEGGAITTNDPDLYHRLGLLRNHGIQRDPTKLSSNPGPWHYEMQEIGFNYRLTDIQAALGISQLSRIEKIKKRRCEIVELYHKLLSGYNRIVLPLRDHDRNYCFHLFTIRIDFNQITLDRKILMERLKARGIGTQVHYIPIHTQPFYQENFGFSWGDFPVAEQYFNETISLPLYPGLTDRDVRFISEGLLQEVYSEVHESRWSTS